MLRRVALRLLGGQEQVEAQVVAVGHLAAEVALDGRLDLAPVPGPAGVGRARVGFTHGRNRSRCVVYRRGVGEALTREWRPHWPCAATSVLGQQRRGAGDPTHRTDVRGRVWRATRTPEGLATLCVESRAAEGVVVGTAWGPGASWALDTMPSLLGAADDPQGFEPLHPAVAEGWRRQPHWRLGASRRVMEALVPSILEQKVTGKQAFGSFRQLVLRHGEPRPRSGRGGRGAAPPRPARARHAGADPVLGVAPARRRARPVAHPGHRVPGRRVPRAPRRRGARGVRPAGPVAARDRRVDQRGGAPAGARRPRRGQLRRLPPGQPRGLGAASATTSATTRWPRPSSPTVRSAGGRRRWRARAVGRARAGGRG